MKKLLAFLLVTLQLISCTASKCSLQPPRLTTNINTILPVKSFVKIQTIVTNEAGGMLAFSSASGFLVSKRTLVTANHFCDTDDIQKHFFDKGMVVDVGFILTTFSGEVYEADVIKTDPKKDLCLMGVPGLIEKSDSEPVRLASRAPMIGEEVFNIAAPLGLFSHEMALIFHGFYSGDMHSPITDGIVSVYSIPIKHGSSGSGIFNARGELIGVVFSGLEDLENVGFSPKYEDVKKFLEP